MSTPSSVRDCCGGAVLREATVNTDTWSARTPPYIGRVIDGAERASWRAALGCRVAGALTFVWIRGEPLCFTILGAAALFGLPLVGSAQKGRSEATGSERHTGRLRRPRVH